MISIDFETTGLNVREARIVEVALVSFKSIESIVYHTIVDPAVRIPAVTTKIHGVGDGTVIKYPTTHEVIPLILKYLRCRVVVGYNLRKYDLPLLQNEAARYGFAAEHAACMRTVRIIDVWEQVSMLTRSQSCRLEAVCSRYGITCDAPTHSALGDATRTGRLLVHLMTHRLIPPLQTLLREMP